MSLISRGALAALLLLSSTLSAAPGIDSAQSKVTATFKQMKVAVEGRFTKVGGSIAFDAAKPEASTANIVIDTGSFDLGMEDYNVEVRKKEWFDSKAHPQATFVSTAFKPLGGDRYQASGRLSLKGRTTDVSVPVSVKKQSAATVFSGSLPISRKAFDIGDAGWNEVLEDGVVINFSIVQKP